MIYSYQKYKEIGDFIQNKPKSTLAHDYTICGACKGLDVTANAYTKRCFGCLFCVFGSATLRHDFLQMWGQDYFKRYAQAAFTGAAMQMPNAQNLIKNPLQNLEDFTAQNETKHIQPWAAGVLQNSCSQPNRLGMEVPVFPDGYARNGRLDICLATERELLVLESKISLEDALKDERFLEQKQNYTKEIEAHTQNYQYLTLIGGKETDLLPSHHPACSGLVGNRSNRFYEMVAHHQIRFLSANAIWCLCCKYLAQGSAYGWDRYLMSLFQDPHCVGLLSAGAVMQQGDDFVIQPL